MQVTHAPYRAQTGDPGATLENAVGAQACLACLLSKHLTIVLYTPDMPVGFQDPARHLVVTHVRRATIPLP